MVDFTLQHPELDGNSFTYDGDSIGILLLHGLTATTAEVRLFANNLRQYGWTISAPLLPGHGTSLLDLERCRWQDWTKQAEESYRNLARRCTRVFIGGESMGGLLATYLASIFPEIAGILLYSPAFRARKLWMTTIAHYFVRFKRKSNLNDGLLWKGYKFHSTRAGYQLLKLQLRMEKQYHLIHQPMAMFLGKLDTTIDLVAAEAIFDQIPASNKSFHIYGASTHCMLLDRELDKITTDSVQFIDNVLSDKRE